MEDKNKSLKVEGEPLLYYDICNIIDNKRDKIASLVNTEICLTNWLIGKRINEDILFNQRADYGKQVVKNLSKRLTERYGKGWSEKKLRHCLRRAETFSEDEIISLTHNNLSWTHIKSLMYINDTTERHFYMLMCCNEHWDTRMLSDNSHIKVAQYYTKLPDKKVLAEKLKKAVAVAREYCYNKDKL